MAKSYPNLRPITPDDYDDLDAIILKWHATNRLWPGTKKAANQYLSLDQATAEFLSSFLVDNASAAASLARETGLLDASTKPKCIKKTAS